MGTTGGQTHLVVVRAIGRFLHGRVFLLLSDLHADHGVHVEPNQLPGLDDGDADLGRAIRAPPESSTMCRSLP